MTPKLWSRIVNFREKAVLTEGVACAISRRNSALLTFNWTAIDSTWGIFTKALVPQAHLTRRR